MRLLLGFLDLRIMSWEVRLLLGADNNLGETLINLSFGRRE